jgi:hypothetical protein
MSYKVNGINIKETIHNGSDSTQTLNGFTKFPTGLGADKTWECPSPFGYTINGTDLSTNFKATYIDYINTPETTYTLPTGVKKLKIICIGGGGYGGTGEYYGPGVYGSGSAGQSGGIILGEINVTPGINTYTVKTSFKYRYVTWGELFMPFTSTNAVFTYNNSSMIAYGGSSGLNRVNINYNNVYQSNITSRLEPSESAGSDSTTNGRTSSLNATIVYNQIGTRNPSGYTNGTVNLTGGVVPTSPDYPSIPNVGNGGSGDNGVGQSAGVRVYFIY